jgi:hypothetical protein
MGDGCPLKDAAGNPLKTGQTVTDNTFGEGIVRGTVTIEKGEALNVVSTGSGRRTARSRRAAARST